MCNKCVYIKIKRAPEFHMNIKISNMQVKTEKQTMSIKLARYEWILRWYLKSPTI